ncbi:uncharacterized protein LOC143885259 [Tasmannia lanceolata]|uniref:uncharacterized protein LOC143885259 n=1 Tax=Tasmannia lanceolata TaxID=3420 RepID=UPI00406432CB
MPSGACCLRAIIDAAVFIGLRLLMKCRASSSPTSSKLSMEFGLILEYQSLAAPVRVVGKALQRNPSEAPWRSIIVLNVSKWSTGSVVPSYCETGGILNPLGAGASSTLSVKGGLLENVFETADHNLSPVPRFDGLSLRTFAALDRLLSLHGQPVCLPFPQGDLPPSLNAFLSSSADAVILPAQHGHLELGVYALNEIKIGDGGEALFERVSSGSDGLVLRWSDGFDHSGKVLVLL